MTHQPLIYCDHHATTPVCPAAIQAMVQAMQVPGNASSPHPFGREAAKVVEDARTSVARLAGLGDPEGVVFTSGATEANNLALRGVVEAARARGIARPHVLVSPIEHSSVLAPLRDMESDGKIELEMIPVAPDGIVRVEGVASRIRDEATAARMGRGRTVLVTVQAANNEIGTIQPVQAIGALCAERGVLFHTDLCQTFGKMHVDPSCYDLASVSAHKVYGPTGVGALIGRDEVLKWIRPQITGGSQERGYRAGTLNTHGIAGFGAACDEMMGTWRSHEGGMGQFTPAEPEPWRLRRLRDLILAMVTTGLGPEWVRVNGAIDPTTVGPRPDIAPCALRLPHNLNLTLVGVCPDTFHARAKDRIAVSAAAACKSIGGDRSHMLGAIGAPDDGAVVRIGLGRCNDEAQAHAVARTIVDVASALRGDGCVLRR